MFSQNISNNPKNKIKECFTKANSFLQTNTDSAIIYAKIGLAVVSDKDYYNQLKFYGLLKDAYDKQVNFKQVIYYLNLMIKIAEDKKDLKTLSNLYTKIGMKYGRTYLYDKAIYYFYKSLDVNILIKDSVGISDSYKNLGLLYLFTNDKKKALINLQTSLNVSLKISDKKSTAFTLKAFGNLYSSGKNTNYFEALNYQLKALKLFEELKDPKEISFTLCDIGETYCCLKKYKTALESFQKSLNVRFNNYDKYYKAYLLNNIGNTYLGLKNYDSTYKYLLQAEDMNKNGHDNGIKSLNYELFSSYYAEKEDFKNAYRYYKLFSEIKDSLYETKSNQSINQLKVKYEIDQFESENQILKQNNLIQQFAIQKQTYLRNTFIAVSILITILVLIVFYRFILKKKANKVLFDKNQQIYLQKTHLEEAYATKEKLFEIITHDLKNPFGSLVSLCSFLESNYYKLEDDHKHKGIESLNRSIGEIYNLLENLTDWLNSKGDNIISEKCRFDISSTILSVLKLYRTSAEEKSIDLQTHVNSNTYVYGDERMIKTVLRNLIDNATKYTATEGKINVNVAENETKVIVSVSDTGIGIKDGSKNNLFKMENHFFKGSGFGLILSKEFIEKNDGEIWFESEVGKGSTFCFSLYKSGLYEKD